MNAERLIALYERVADAPDAVFRLRRFVLDLAVRGKLVAQDPADEPASELLKRIAAEKARLVKAGEIRKPKATAPIEPDNLPFDLPLSWQWVRLSDILTKLTDGTHHSPPNGPDGDFLYITAKNIKDDGVKLDDVSYVSREVHEEIYARCNPEPGDILYIKDGATTGIVTVNGLEEPFSMLSSVALLKLPACVFNQLIVVFLRSPFFYEQMRSFMKGAAITRVTLKRMGPALLPLPPLAEQRRIVAKVDELMALLDQLEATRHTREATRDRLAAATLARLTAPDTPAEEANARFALNTLPALTTRPDQIKSLRQTILNLAVRGKLVAGNQGSDGWHTVPLGQLLREGTRNGYARRPDDAVDGIPILRISAGTVRQDGVVAEEEHKLIGGIDPQTRDQFGLKQGDLLACRFNGNKAFVGRLTLFSDYLGLDPIYPDKLIRVRLDREKALPEYIRLAGESDMVRQEIESFCATTVGNWGISASNLQQVNFPMPPLDEQHRIVAKVEALMALCDQLEVALTTANTTRTRLLEALLHEALHPVATPAELDPAEC